MLRQRLEKENLFRSKKRKNQFPFYGTCGRNVSTINSVVNIH
uniref:ORF41m n=1 Tax=Pinus koraiensis TaxID=88728 RepID=Q85WU0_PINKO|nr:ORF41m [Pinus koraiensis]